MITYLLHSGWLGGWFESQGKKGVCIERNMHCDPVGSLHVGQSMCKQSNWGHRILQDSRGVHRRVYWRVPHLFLLPPSLLPSTPLPVRSWGNHTSAIILNLILNDSIPIFSLGMGARKPCCKHKPHFPSSSTGSAPGPPPMPQFPYPLVNVTALSPTLQPTTPSHPPALHTTPLSPWEHKTKIRYIAHLPST